LLRTVPEAVTSTTDSIKDTETTYSSSFANQLVAEAKKFEPVQLSSVECFISLDQISRLGIRKFKNINNLHIGTKVFVNGPVFVNTDTEFISLSTSRLNDDVIADDEKEENNILRRFIINALKSNLRFVSRSSWLAQKPIRRIKLQHPVQFVIICKLS
jgi:hypothetical protein